MPWKNAVFTHELPVLFAVSPASNESWMVDTMPRSQSSTWHCRNPGQDFRPRELVKETGVGENIQGFAVVACQAIMAARETADYRGRGVAPQQGLKGPT
jgi:hypothetical protein